MKKLLSLLYTLILCVSLSGCCFSMVKPKEDEYNPSVVWVPSAFSLENFELASWILSLFS